MGSKSIFMVAMALLGGKGTIWGPVVGAIVFHIIKEATWSTEALLNKQWIVLGILLIIIVIFFPKGIIGTARDKFPRFFGIKVDESVTKGGAS